MDVLAKLVLVQAGQVVQEFDLQHDVTTLGRAPSCQIHLTGDFASRRHAQIIRRDDVCWLHDLGSKNGTIVDGQRVESDVRLVDGAEIQIGDMLFRFYDLAATRTYHVAAEYTPDGRSTIAPKQPQLRVLEAAREVWFEGTKLDPALSPKQFDLLLCLWKHIGQAVSRDDIAAAVWPEAASDAVYNYQIDKMVSRLRERLSKEMIETVWGFGFKLRSIE